MNSVQLTGNIGKDLDVKMTANGQAMAKFSVAVNHKYTDRDGQEKSITDWVPVVAWGSLAEAAGNSLKKGDRVYVAGRIVTKSWNGPDGKRQYATEVTARIIAIPLLAGAKTGESNASAFEGFGAERPESYIS